MKILFLFFTLVLSISSTFSQNITNTLPPNGEFKIKDGTTEYLKLNQSNGNLTLFRNLELGELINSTSDVGVITKGGERFLHNYGINNTFLGSSSGNFSLTGVANTAIGTLALNLNTSGSGNTAVGFRALSSNTIGFSNCAFGPSSLYLNTTGANNSAFGASSLFNNTVGGYNSAFGWGSLRSNTEGNDNNAFGAGSLYSNTTGSYNTANGISALYSNISGEYNSAFGYSSMSTNTTGINNLALGVYSLNSNNADENTGVGNYSLYKNTTGWHNTALGFNALYYNTTGWQNTAVGHHSLLNNTGNYNTALGYNAGSTVTSGSNLTLIGIDANPSSPTATDQVTLGNIYVSSLRCNVQTITSLSDIRDKKNIKDLALGLDFITKLKPRQFNWDGREWYENNVSDGSKMKEDPTAGFIAQELDEVQSAENAEWLNLVLKDNPDKWEATYGNLLPVMVKAIQELKEEKDNEIAKLYEKILDLEKELNAMRNTKNVIQISNNN